MSWTAHLDSAVRSGPDVQLRVTYTNADGSVVISETYFNAGPDQLKQTVINRIAQLSNVDSDLQSLTPGPVDTTVAPPPSPPTPTAAQLAQQQFFSDLDLYQRIKRNLVDTGILTGTETFYVNLQAKIRSEFLASYVTSLT